METNKYAQWWKENKNALSLIPALIFLVVSMIFFIVGLKFENPIIMFGTDISIGIAVALSISNTIIQIIGNERETEEMGIALRAGWYASYCLGIGTNIYGIMSIIVMSNQYLEGIVAVSLGAMIEFLPEKLLVQYLRSITQNKKNLTEFHQPYRPITSNQSREFKYPLTSFGKGKQSKKDNKKIHRFPQESLMNEAPLDGRLKSRLFDDNYIKHQVKRKK